MRLLLVEDDALLGEGIRAGLAQAGFAVDWVRDGEQARAALESEPYALMVLDLGLPRLSGEEVLRRLRGKNSSLPVLILTARDTVADRVKGLDAGADDYLVKPFDLDELTARLRALLRRSGGRAAPLITRGALSVDPAAHAVALDGRPVDLSPKEFAVLLHLLENAGRVRSREQLEQSLYAWGEEVESNAVEVHIHHLRKKLGSELIRTLRGVGYMIDKNEGGRMKDEGKPA
jgi:Response regulators consisting of a CheY-like receiver domain and a winged-helix DNA-binding domain